MRALSVRRPWPWCILRAGKRIENRMRADGRMPSLCTYRGPLLIHASAGCTRAEYTDAIVWMYQQGLIKSAADVPAFEGMDAGAFVGLVEVVGHVEPLPNGKPGVFRGQTQWYDPHPGEDLRWHVPGSYGLVFAKDVTPLPMAVPWKGVLGLFDVRAEDVLALPPSVSPPEATHALAKLIRQHSG